MKQPLVSVIITCYNYADFIEECVRSIFKQTYGAIEITVINDGSTDASDVVIRRLKKEFNIQYVSHANQGIVAVRNEALSLAKGKYLLQIDADDYILPDYVQSLVDVAERDDLDIVYTPAVDPDTGRTIIQPPKFNIKTLIMRNYIHTSPLFRTDVIKKHRYDEALSGLGLEDWDMNLSLCLSGARAARVEGVSLQYRQHPASRGHASRGSIRNPAAIHYIVKKYAELYPQKYKDITWMADNIGRVVMYASQQEQEVRGLVRKKESLAAINETLSASVVELRDKINRQQDTIDMLLSRKALRLYDGVRHATKHPMAAAGRIAKKAKRVKHTHASTKRKRTDVLYEKSWLDRGVVVNPIVREGLEMDGPDEVSAVLGEYNSNQIDWTHLRDKEYVKNKVTVIVLVLNNLEMTLRCINSILNAKNSTSFDLVVVDNGSDATTIKGLRDAKATNPELTLVHNEQNLNFSLGNNIGFEYATGDISIFINNDTYVTDEWIDHLVKPLIKRKEVKAVQPSLFYPDDTTQCMGVVFSDKSSIGYALYPNFPIDDKRVVKSRDLSAVTAACIAVRSVEFADVKGFDPIYINGQEDIDLCLRLTDNGKKGVCHCSADSVVYHDESKTPGRGARTLVNRKVFLNRWQSKIASTDREIYSNDGFIIDGWIADSEQAVMRDVHTYIPKLSGGYE